MSYEYREHRRILLIDQNSRKLNLRATILRNHEIEVHTCNAMSDAPAFWKTIPYDLILMALAPESDEVQQVTEQIRLSKPRQRIGLLIGPPAFIREISRTPLKRTIPEPTPVLPQPVPAERASEPQWQYLVGKVIADWYSNHAMVRSIPRSHDGS